MVKSVEERFEEKVERVTESGCWIWMANSHRQGYGKIYYQGKTAMAHRVSYELHSGEIPEGMCVCHRCDVTGCVNPDHLFLGTNQDNMTDKINKGRHKGAKKGEQHHNAKLTATDISEIRESVETQKELAKRYGVSQATVHNIKAEKRWRNH